MRTPPGLTNKHSFGICDINRMSPPPRDLSGDTKILNVEITFEEALKLNLAINACLQKLNSYKRNTIAGKRTSMNLAIYLQRSVVTVNEGKLPADGNR
jgi:hypothetical protein